ncbi:hypothetical protein ACWA7J_08230 [Leptothrix sp. BB-4]
MNRTHTLPARRLLGLASTLALLLGACGNAPAAAPRADEAAPLLRRIEQTIGTASCQRDSDCRTVPVGQKSCGGPEAWLPWSTRTVSTPERQQALTDLARQHAQARTAAHQASGMMSNCSVLPDPGATCQAQRCVLREAAPGDPAMVPR